jgi:hypothetical protein
VKSVILLLAVLLLPVAEADVGLRYSYYNSLDELSGDVCGENISFESFEALMPDSMLYKDVGQSTTPDSSYSYSVKHNEDKLHSNATVDSGSLSWGADADFGYYCPGSQSFALNAKNYVKDGSINASYGNPNIEIWDRIEAMSAEFSESLKITSGKVSSEGSGGTIVSESPVGLDSSSAKSQNFEVSEALGGDSAVRGFRQRLAVEGLGRHGEIAADVVGDTECIWKSSVKADLSSISFGLSLRGTCSGSMDQLGMVGRVSGYPTQILPPGEIKIFGDHDPTSVKLQNSTDSGTEERLDRIDEETSEFRESYELQSSEALWYYIDQTASATIAGGRSTVPDNLPRENYLMKMGFLIDPE